MLVGSNQPGSSHVEFMVLQPPQFGSRIGACLRNVRSPNFYLAAKSEHRTTKAIELTFLGTRGEIKVRSRRHQRHSTRRRSSTETL